MRPLLPDFLIIPSVILNDPDMQPLDGYVYGVLYWQVYLKLEKCFMTNKDIADLLRVHQQSVSRSLANLKSKGYIYLIVNSDAGNTREIVPTIHQNVYTPINQNVDRVNQNVYRGGQSVPKPEPIAFEDKKEKKEEEKESNKEREEEKKEPVPFEKVERVVDQQKARLGVKEAFFGSKQESLLNIKKCSPPKAPCGACSRCSLVPCTEDEMWEIAKHLNIAPADVEQKHAEIVEMLETGEFQTRYKKLKTVYNTLRNWLRMGIENGRFQTLNAIEQVVLLKDSPSERRRKQALIAEAIKKGVL